MQGQPESARKGMSRRAVLIAGVSAVGVVAIGGTALVLATRNGHITTGGTQTTPSATSRTTTTATTQVNPNILAQDNFNRRDQPFWGIASDGSPWGGDALNSNDFSIANHRGKIHRTAGGNSLYTALLGTKAYTDFEVIATAMLDTFNSSHIGVMLRYQDDNHYYKARITGTVLDILNRQDAQHGPTIASTPFTAQPGTLYTIRFQVIGSQLRAKAWQANSSEPANWMVTANANTFQHGQGGMRPQLNQGATLQITMYQETVPTNP